MAVLGKDAGTEQVVGYVPSEKKRLIQQIAELDRRYTQSRIIDEALDEAYLHDLLRRVSKKARPHSQRPVKQAS